MAETRMSQHFHRTKEVSRLFDFVNVTSTVTVPYNCLTLTEHKTKAENLQPDIYSNNQM